jgi:hypothetical protein
VLSGLSNIRCSGQVVMMAKTCLIHNPVGKSLGLKRLESLSFLLFDNIAIRSSENLVTDVDVDYSLSLSIMCLQYTELQPT